jgi:O-6-methylguanine DNA methyltransferase
MKFKDKVYKVVSKIPKGQTMSYAEVAEAAGSPKAYRAVGNIMHNNPDTTKVPCHRVIKSDGTAGGYAGGTKKKIALLKKEGVKGTKI